MIYGKCPRVLSKDKDKIVIELGGRKVEIHENDEIIVLSDIFADELEGTKPTVFTLTFDEFYERVKRVGNSEDYELIYDIKDMSGICLIHY